YGPDSAVALDVVRGLRSTRDLLAGLDAGETEQALRRLRATLAAHQTGDGVVFDARPWIITARRSQRIARMPGRLRRYLCPARRMHAPSRRQMYVPIRAVIDDGLVP